MVAVLLPESTQKPTSTAASPDPAASPDRPDGRPSLRLIEGGASTAKPSRPAVLLRRSVPLVLAATILMAMLVLRLAQGTPPASSWEGLVERAYEPAGSVIGLVEPSETVYIVQAGDTLWDLALKLAPGRDPRPVVELLATRNGGAALQVGQRLIVPADLG